jgi:thiol-disulfide isomerase/thioredoxin
MKRIILIMFLGILAGCYGINSSKTGMEGKSMPSFSMLLIDSITKVNTSSIKTDKPVIMFFFSPDCPFCRALTKDIIDNIESFKNIKIYMLTNFPFNQLKNFYNEYQLAKYSNITIAYDFDSYFPSYYKVTGIPYLAIYSKDKILKQVLVGKFSTTLIKDITVE